MKLLIRNAVDHYAVRDATQVRLDKRDLLPDGRPKGIFRPLGAKIAESPPEEIPGWVEFDHLEPIVPHPDEKEFDHMPTPEELEKILGPLTKPEA